MTQSTTAMSGSGSPSTSDGKTTKTPTHTSNRPEKQCDIVMAGGATSGVVYPQAILRLARDYRFRSIGGTSAGAIAAAAAAAAEFGRQNGNPGSFGIIGEKFNELEGKLLPLFQPQSGTHRLFGFTVNLISAKAGGSSPVGAFGKLVRTLLYAYRAPFLFGLVVFALLVIALTKAGSLPAPTSWPPVPAFAAIMLALVFALVWVLTALWYDIDRLKSLNFGMCPGPKQRGYSRPALLEWIHNLVQKAAGLPEGNLLTFKDLAKIKFSDDQPGNERGIDLRMMTTNVSLGTGYALPSLGDGRYFYALDDMKAILPKSVFKVMEPTAQATDSKTKKEITCGGVPLFDLPVGDEMPVILAVRMSLSFPLLFTAVPLYKAEIVEIPPGAPLKEVYTVGALVKGTPSHPNLPLNSGVVVRKVWFSDGGITSNFPVRFFDSLVPTRPTFGIALEDREDSAIGETAASPPEVFLPMPKDLNRKYEIRTINSVPGFLMSAVSAAREWQDRKQARLPGWQERIARLYLKKGEGGLNLEMDKNIIGNLVDRGRRASELLAATPDTVDQHAFDFEEHQWRRLLVAHRVFSEALANFDRKWNTKGLAEALAKLQAKHGIAGSDYPLSEDKAKAIIEDMGVLSNLAANFSKNSAANPMMAEHARIEIVPRDPIS